MDGTETKTPLQKQNGNKQGVYATIPAIYCPFQCNDYVCICSKQLQKSKYPINNLFLWQDRWPQYLLSPASIFLVRDTPYQTRDLRDHLLLLLTTLHTLLTGSPEAMLQGALPTSVGKQVHLCPTGSMRYQKLSHHSEHLSAKMVLKSRHSCSCSM